MKRKKSLSTRKNKRARRKAHELRQLKLQKLRAEKLAKGWKPTTNYYKHLDKLRQFNSELDKEQVIEIREARDDFARGVFKRVVRRVTKWRLELRLKKLARQRSMGRVRKTDPVPFYYEEK